MSRAMSGARGWQFAVCILCGLATLAFELWLFRPLIASYFPTDDTIALIVASTDIDGPLNWRAWFTDGFHGYLLPFPEWTVPHSDYVRPLSNAYIGLQYWLFGMDWGLHLVPAYVFHALAVTLTAWMSLRWFKLPPVLATLSIAIAVFNPAFWSRADYTPFLSSLTRDPICQTEVLDALLMMLAMTAFMRRRFWVFGLLGTAALLLKETAITMPVMALVMTSVWARGSRRRAAYHAFLIVLPLLLWAGMRVVWFAHGSEFSPIQASSPAKTILQPLRNLAFWPTGQFHDSLGGSITAARSGQWSVVVPNLLTLIVDLAWWLVLLYALRRLWPLLIHPKSRDEFESWHVALVFALGNLALVLSLQVTNVRYGYFWFAVGPAAIFAMLPTLRTVTLAAAVLTTALLLPLLIDIHTCFAPGSGMLASYRQMRQSGVQLSALLRQLPADTKLVYLLDDFPNQSSSPEYLARLDGFKGSIVIINNIVPIEDCKPPPIATQRYQLTRNPVGDRLDYVAPDCFFSPINFSSSMPLGPDGAVARRPWLTYHYPALAGGTVAMATPASGQRWTLESRDPICMKPGACVWLGFDPATTRYYPLSD